MDYSDRVFWLGGSDNRVLTPDAMKNEYPTVYSLFETRDLTYLDFTTEDNSSLKVKVMERSRMNSDLILDLSDVTE